MAAEEARRTYANIINGEGQFIAEKAELERVMRDANLADEYAVVAIMGVQSSGKSTLLNLLFGTQFRVMDARSGRSQTTLGVWLDTAEKAEHVVVMDLEGTDSGERGEDRTTFERQTTLYALALAEVLIVNMWVHDVGRYTASNYGILRTVFEVNLQLFKNPGKTKLLFIVRDHTESETPLELLHDKIWTEISKIWAELPKPPEHQGKDVDEFFDFDLVGLPHKNLQRAEFESAVADLRNRFLRESHEDYIFDEPYHLSKSVPIDGFTTYAERIWTSIQDSKDLNLPSQKEMLATVRCDELSDAAFREFQEAHAAIEAELADGNAVVRDLGSRGSELVEAAVAQFDEVANKYMPQVVNRKRSDLREKMLEVLHRTFRLQMEHTHRVAFAAFLEAFRAGLPSGAAEASTVADDFYGVVDAAQADAEKRVREVHEFSLVGDAAWDVAEPLGKLREELDRQVASERQSQLNKVPREAELLAKQMLLPRANALMNKVEDPFWPELREMYDEFAQDMADALAAKLDGLRVDESERAHALAASREVVRKLVYEAVEQQAQLAGQKLRKRFDAKFQHDENGLPRKWGGKKKLPIRKLFVEARDFATQLLDWYAVFQIDGPVPGFQDGSDPNAKQVQDDDEPAAADPSTGGPPVLVRSLSGFDVEYILNDLEREEIMTKFLNAIENALQEAEYTQERAHAVTKIPKWLYVVLAVVGFDEFVAVVTNPLLMFLAVMIGTAYFVVFVLDMGGPAKFIIMNTLRQAVEYVHQQFGVDLAHLVPGMQAARQKKKSDDPVDSDGSDSDSGATPTSPKSPVPASPSRRKSPSKLRRRRKD